MIDINNKIWLIVTLSVFTLTTLVPRTKGQLIESLSQCVQICIDRSTYQTCNLLDISCICREGSGQFLPDVISCMHDECNNDLDSSLFLTPLSVICQLAGTPIPASALSSAQNQASSLATQATTSATVTVGGGSTPLSTTTIPEPFTTATVDGQTVSWGGPETSTIYGSYVSTTTVTTTKSGSTIYEIYPITVGQTTTVSGPTSTVTPTWTGSSTGGSTSSSTDRQSSSSATSTGRSSSIVAGGASSSTHRTTSPSGRSISTSTIFLPEKTTGSQTTSTSTAARGGPTDSAPFTNTNTNGGIREKPNNWLGLSIFFGVLTFWL